MTLAKPQEFLTRLTAASRPVLALVHGDDRSAVRDLCRKAVAAILVQDPDQLGLSRLTEAQVTNAPDLLHNEFASLSMFGGESMIWIGGCGDAMVKVIEPILSGEMRGNFILLDAEYLQTTSKLRRLVEASAKSVGVALYEESSSELRSRLTRQITDAGLTLTPEASEKLMESISFARGVADHETQKLITYCHGQSQIEVDDVIAICGDTSETSGDELSDAVFEGRLQDADRCVQSYGASHASGRSCLSVLLQHVVRLQSLAVQIGPGNSPENIVGQRQSGVFFKRRQSFGRQLRIWDAASLLDAEARICAAILQTRQYAEVSAAIENRAALALARLALLRQSSVN